MLTFCMHVCACKSGTNLKPPTHHSATRTKHLLENLLCFGWKPTHHKCTVVARAPYAWCACNFHNSTWAHGVLAHHFRTWPYMRTRTFLAVSSITNYRVYIYNNIYIYIYIYEVLQELPHHILSLNTLPGNLPGTFQDSMVLKASLLSLTFCHERVQKT